MAIEKLNIDQFLELAKDHPVIDVRSPGEFLHAHIPGAVNLPLFNDEERKVVGTLYKQKSREEAIKAGLDFLVLKCGALLNLLNPSPKKISTTLKAKTVIKQFWFIAGGAVCAAALLPGCWIYMALKFILYRVATKVFAIMFFLFSMIQFQFI